VRAERLFNPIEDHDSLVSTAISNRKKVPHYLLKEQSPEAYTPGWIVEPGAFGGMVIPNDDPSDTLTQMPWVAALLFLVVAWMTYAFDVDDSGGGLSLPKIIFIAFWGLVFGMGAVFSRRKVRRRERMGDTLVELEEPLLAPGLTTTVRIYQSRPLRLKNFAAELSCFHHGFGETTRLLDTSLCSLASAELGSGDVIWEGALHIPADADVPRLAPAKLEDRSWEPPLNELGPSTVVANRAGGRCPQQRYWKILIAFETAEGVLIRENYDLQVFFAEDRASLMADSQKG
jgi:hypothetical protein